MHYECQSPSEFMMYVEELLQDPEVQSMHNIPQHVKQVDCFDHSFFVAWLAYRICRRMGWDAKAAARAGMLHDLYLCDWDQTDVGLWERLLIHPRMAANNARRFGISEQEEHIILTHMWPVTISALPRSREAFAVNLADKLSTIAEVTHTYGWLGLRPRRAVAIQA